MTPINAGRRAWKVSRRLKGATGGSKRPNRLPVIIVGVVTMIALTPMMVFIVLAGGVREGDSVSAQTLGDIEDIPAEALAAYRDASEHWDIDWAILAGIGKVECDHGRYQGDGCNPPLTMNHAGARGYMQFIGSTWRGSLGQHEMEPRDSPPAPDGQGYATDGSGDGYADPWNWYDAAHSAARYLTDHDYHDDQRQALYAYNRSWDYVDDVLAHADRYRQAADGHTTDDGLHLITVRGITVNADIAHQVAALVDHAEADGLTLAGGGYRDNNQQIALRRANCGTSHYAIYEMPSSQCSPPTAPPGRSMHERGLAIDFTCNGASISTRSSPCFAWLAEHAATYGLHNLPSEPWHWSTNGS